MTLCGTSMSANVQTAFERNISIVLIILAIIGIANEVSLHLWFTGSYDFC